MGTDPDQSQAWEQLAFALPEAVTIHLRIGVVAGADHVQAQVEVWDASLGQLIAMESWPSVDLDRADRVIRKSALKAVEQALKYVPTFP